MAYTLFVVLIVLVSLLMIFIVLIQESKGGGLASNFSSTNSIMGVRKTTDIVEKLTWGLAAAMVIISVACAYVAPQATGDSSVMEGATQEQTALPAMPGATGDQAAGSQKGAAAPAANGSAAPAANGQKAAPVVPASPAK
nr:preprotein translocase subunit SecG [uncultured Prevotella sp.]